MSDLKQLNLSEKDFDLLVEGLDAISEKGMAGELMGSLFESMLLKDGDNEARQKMEWEREKRYREREIKKKEMKEDVTILQGKLLLLKRLMIEQGALNEINDILRRD